MLSIKNALRLLCATVILIPLPALAENFSITLWNIQASETLQDLEARQKNFKQFGQFAKNSDAIVLVELTKDEDLSFLIKKSGFETYNKVISDFDRDDAENPFHRLEVAILTPNTISQTKEFDPFKPDKKDQKVVIPSWIPKAQRYNIGYRGWLWAEIKEKKLALAAVHLKSSRGQDTNEKALYNSQQRENIAASLAEFIKKHKKTHPEWSYIVAGDFNVSQSDHKSQKSGVDLHKACKKHEKCTDYDQTHAIFQSGLVKGFYMRNLVAGLSNTHISNAFSSSPIDIVYGSGPMFDKAHKITAQKGELFGSDHYAVRVDLESK